MGFLGRLWKSEAAQWVGLAVVREENPVFQFLQLVSKRRKGSQKWYARGAPLIIGAIPTLIWLGFMAYEYYTSSYAYGMDEASKYAPLVFLVISYVSWAAMGANLAILDAMSLLRRSTKQSARFELDDLACVTSVTDSEIVAGFMGHTLPQLFLRIVAGVGLGWLIILLIATEWFSSFSQDTWTLIALSPISIGLWSASGCVGVTALIAFYLALGSGRSSIPASIASLVVLGSQGIWLITSIFLVTVYSQGVFGTSSFPNEFTNHVSVFAAPVIVLFLILSGMRIALAYPALKPVQAIGSPLLLPFLALIVVSLLLANSGFFNDEITGIFVLSYIWHFGDMLPLNFGILAFPVFYTGDLLGGTDGLLNLWYRPITIALAQLVLLYFCLGYAKKAVGQRRQAG